MREFPSDIAFTPTVKAVQQRKGSRGSYARIEKGRGWRTTVTPDLAEFLAGLDMFYLGTAWDVNCPQHIHQRFSQRQIAPVIAQLQARVAELEFEVERLRSKARSEQLQG